MLSGRRTRSGIANDFLLLIILVAALIIGLTPVVLTLEDQQAIHAEQTRMTYNQLATLEEVLNAGCVTEYRGVFRGDRITDAANFDCIAVAQTLEVAFETDANTYFYRFPGEGGTPESINKLSTTATAQVYPILVKMSDGTYETGYLKYHVRAG